MLYTIYRVTHRESGKVYIGKHQTNDPNDGYMGSGQLIRRAVKKYGPGAFDKEVLCVFSTEEEMNAKEAELVTEEFCSREDTYNMCPGGHGGWGYVNASRKAVNIADQGLDRTKISLAANAAREAKRKSDPEWNASYKKALAAAERRKIAEGRHPFQNLAKPANEGKAWITDGSKTKKINRGDAVPDGWRLGRQ